MGYTIYCHFYEVRKGFMYVWTANAIVCLFTIVGVLGIVLNETIVQEFSVCKLGDLDVHIFLKGDVFSLGNIFMVFLISSLVQVFSFQYMYSETRLLYSQLLLQFFTLVMFLFVMAGDLIVAFVAWEGLGFASYLLITFWYTRLEAQKAGVKAIIMNRVADIAFIVVIALSWKIYRTWNFDLINSLTYFMDSRCNCIVDVLGVLLLFAAMGKSAQIGFHSWLVAAMEGPSPVSALLHSATMVAAGVILLLRCQGVFQSVSYIVLLVIVLVGSSTFVWASWQAACEFDLKRIVAYSTCSHLGLLFLMVGLNLFEVASLHIYIHAFFKMALFLCSGLLMVIFLHNQSLVQLTGVGRFVNISYVIFFISALSLLGTSYTVGSFSKERFLTMFSTIGIFDSYNLLLFFVVVAQLFVFVYSIRLVWAISFSSSFNGDRMLLTYADYERNNLTVPFLVSVVFILLSGYLLVKSFSWDYINLVAWNWNSLYNMAVELALDWLPFYVRYYVLFLIMVVGVVYFFQLRFPFSFITASYIESVYSRVWNIILFQAVRFAQGYSLYIEHGIIQIAGPVGLFRWLRILGQQVVKLEVNLIEHYVYFVIIALLDLILYIGFIGW